jgi:hypothetical protein
LALTDRWVGNEQVWRLPPDATTAPG